uniref:Uncharacterized protein n=1 Tax=Oryza brachyantha TaxID=4533 RepID=J3MQ29_ORYBR
MVSPFCLLNMAYFRKPVMLSYVVALVLSRVLHRDMFSRLCELAMEPCLQLIFTNRLSNSSVGFVVLSVDCCYGIWHAAVVFGLLSS